MLDTKTTIYGDENDIDIIVSLFIKIEAGIKQSGLSNNCNVQFSNKKEKENFRSYITEFLNNQNIK